MLWLECGVSLARITKDAASTAEGHSVPDMRATASVEFAATYTDVRKCIGAPRAHGERRWGADGPKAINVGLLGIGTPGTEGGTQLDGGMGMHHAKRFAIDHQPGDEHLHLALGET
jgi:hypothetical protein